VTVVRIVMTNLPEINFILLKQCVLLLISEVKSALGWALALYHVVSKSAWRRKVILRMDAESHCL
jgi:hypothetical protein